MYKLTSFMHKLLSEKNVSEKFLIPGMYSVYVWFSLILVVNFIKKKRLKWNYTAYLQEPYILGRVKNRFLIPIKLKFPSLFQQPQPIFWYQICQPHLINDGPILKCTCLKLMVNKNNMHDKSRIGNIFISKVVEHKCHSGQVFCHEHINRLQNIWKSIRHLYVDRYLKVKKKVDDLTESDVMQDV